MDENMMADEILTLVDEDGKEMEFEVVGHCEMDGVKYIAIIPADENDEAEFYEYSILKSVIEDGEEFFVSFGEDDDEDEFDKVAAFFDDMFTQEIDYDAK